MNRLVMKFPIKQTSYLALFSVFLCACTGVSTKSVPKQQSVLNEKPQSTANFNSSLWPERQASPALDPSVERRVSSILANMSVEEKVGQVIQPEYKFVTPDDVRKYHLGSILNGGGTTPNNNKKAKLADWVESATEYYNASMDESDGKQGIPLIWGMDAVHGNNNVYGATIFPHNIGLGAAADGNLIERIGEATARELAVTGVNWTFAPTVAVVRDVRWGRTYESYSEDPKIVQNYAGLMVKGLQGQMSLGNYQPQKVVATAKHFVGDGGTYLGVDRGDTQISEHELVKVHASGYMSALDANVLTTMASFNSWNGEKVHGHKYLLTDILKQRLGFNGLVVSDWNGHMQVTGCSVKQCAHAINAGIDLVMVPSDWRAFWNNTLSDVRAGKISMQRLDDAVRRVLRVKLMAGLFEAGPIENRSFVGKEGVLGSSEHRALAREAVRKSLVLLKNDNSVLPINPKSEILVVGDAANNIGKQAGGWTLTWQGLGNSNADFPGASSIWQGIQSAVDSAGGRVVLSEDGSFEASAFKQGKPEVAVVVYGEEPYAEWHGDISNIEYQASSKRDLATLKRLKSQGIPVVSVFISGRPLWVNKEINASDAFVAAWLPGSEGEGVADVLLRNKNGDINHDFSGKLSFSWPNLADQATVNVGDHNYAPLFAYGYGLNYQQASELGSELDESAPLVARGKQQEDQWLFVSRVMSDYFFEIADQGKTAIEITGNKHASGADNNLVITSIDMRAQEDARQVVWKGLRPAMLELKAKHPRNLSSMYEEGVLSFKLTMGSQLSSHVSLSLVCDNGCENKVNLGELNKNQVQQDFVPVQIPLACLAKDATSLASVTGLFQLHSESQARVDFADIKLRPKPDTNEVMYDCK